MNLIFLFLSTLGFLDSTFLTIQHYNKDPFSCPLFGGCEEVTSSVYSEILGIPVALFGVIYYTLIFTLSLYSYLKNNKKTLAYAAQLTAIGFFTSFYLVYIQLYVLSAICFYCMLSAVTSTSLFAFGIRYLANLKKFETKFVLDYFSSLTMKDKILGVSRISLGFIFFWAFISKAGVWLSGGYPAKGFLENGTKGVFAEIFMAGSENYLINFLYMFGLFAVGLALILGITKSLATIGGVLMMGFIYIAALPPANNPLIDEHIMYILIFLLLYLEPKSYSAFGFYDKWIKIKAVEKHKLLR